MSRRLCDLLAAMLRPPSRRARILEKALGRSTTFTPCRCCHSRRKYTNIALPWLIVHKAGTRDADINSGNFIEYLLDREDVIPVWQDYTHHDFCVKMGNGTLPREAYKTYMIQDYLYLVCRVHPVWLLVTTDFWLDSICSGKRFGELQIHFA